MKLIKREKEKRTTSKDGGAVKHRKKPSMEKEGNKMRQRKASRSIRFHLRRESSKTKKKMTAIR